MIYRAGEGCEIRVSSNKEFEYHFLDVNLVERKVSGSCKRSFDSFKNLQHLESSRGTIFLRELSKPLVCFVICWS